MPSPFLADAQELRDEVIAIRRDLHMHPELGFQEVRTARIVAEKLSALGYETITGVGKTGVIGLMAGALPGDKTVLLRFDMDALPIEEANDVPYRSQTPGVMHACGHDAHVAIGLGVADVLARHRDSWGGTIKLMFQPAEEGLGGARAMLEDGVLKGPDVDIALALHVSSGHPTGTAVIHSGAIMAAGDGLTITVHGRGGHGARPHETIDAVLVASHIVVGLQTIVARNLNPEDVGVISMGIIQAGTAGNVIAETATIRGSIRSFTPAARQLMHRRAREVAEGIAAAHGATAEVAIRIGVDAVMCAEEPTEQVYQAATEVLGAEQIDTRFRDTASEDFSAVLSAVPGNYFFLGAQDNARGLNAPHHNPHFDIDEGCLPLGIAILSDSAVRILADEG